MNPLEAKSTYIILSALGPEIRVLIRHSTKAKNIAIRIKNIHAELVVPKNKIQISLEFARQKESWIRKKLQTLEAARLMGEHHIRNDILPILGKEYRIEYKADIRSHVIQEEATLVVYTRGDNHRNVLIDFLSKLLLQQLTDYAQLIAQNNNLHYTKIKIMNNKTRWGSCSSKGILAFHWRLIFTPLEVLNYLVVHEICHLKEMNHGARFWKLVEKIYPQYKQAQKWLKTNGFAVRKFLEEDM